jgi:hypothetical protein
MSKQHRKVDKTVSARQKYEWPPRPDPDVPYQPANKNAIHSILTALPILMLVAGLYMFYRSENAQTEGAPIVAESVESSGIYTGLSVVGSGGNGRHYLWFESGGRARGPRITSKQAGMLDSLVVGQAIQVHMAPTIPGSSILWAYHVEQRGIVILDVPVATT